MFVNILDISTFVMLVNFDINQTILKYSRTVSGVV